MKENEIAAMLKGYLPECSHIFVSRFGDITDIEVEYEDFKSVPEVRKWIEHRIPGVSNITLWRSYSDKVVSETLERLYDDDLEVQRKVESFLFARNLG